MLYSKFNISSALVKRKKGGLGRYLRQLGLEVGGVEHVLELSELLVRDLALPLQLATALGDHGAEVLVLVHPLLEGLEILKTEG